MTTIYKGLSYGPGMGTALRIEEPCGGILSEVSLDHYKFVRIPQTEIALRFRNIDPRKPIPDPDQLSIDYILNRLRQAFQECHVALLGMPVYLTQAVNGESETIVKLRLPASALPKITRIAPRFKPA